MWGGITFPCAQIKGLADRAKQDKINQALREPLTVLAQADWDDEIRYKENLKETDIYVAYKSEQWLSIVYLFVVVETSPGDWEWKYRGDGIVDFGVTVDMQTGERCMLDDLFEKQGFLPTRHILFVSRKACAFQFMGGFRRTITGYQPVFKSGSMV